jgi:PDZ domain
MPVAAIHRWMAAAMACLLAFNSAIRAQDPFGPAMPGAGKANPQGSPPAITPRSTPANLPRPEIAKPVPSKLAPARPAPSKPAPSPEELAAWVRELDADEFLTRETAMTQLLEAGPPALAALKPVLAAGSLEATSRGLFVVRQLGLSPDDQTQDLATQMLEELAAREETPLIARRAAAAWQELKEERTALAQSELANLGAKIARTQVAGGFFVNEGVLSIEIGDDFRGKDGDLKRLKWLSDVPILMLVGKQVTDEWLKYAASLPGLEELHLYQTTITDAGLAPLRDHPTLKQLGIYYAPISDKALDLLKGLPRLVFVKLYGTKVTVKAKDNFRAATTINVDHRRGAFLGVGARGAGGGCRISRVHDGSPAAKAGLVEDDEVIRFGPSEIKNFDELTNAISLCNAGDDVEIEVIRRQVDNQGNFSQRNVIAKVALTPWELEPAVHNVRPQ